MTRRTRRHLSPASHRQFQLQLQLQPRIPMRLQGKQVQQQAAAGSGNWTRNRTAQISSCLIKRILQSFASLYEFNIEITANRKILAHSTADVIKDCWRKFTFHTPRQCWHSPPEISSFKAEKTGNLKPKPGNQMESIDKISFSCFYSIFNSI